MMIKLFDLSLKLSGYPIKQAKEEYQRILAIPEGNYAEYVEKKKKEIVQFHYENNSFYRSLVGDKLPEKWEDLPVLTKRDLQKPLAQRLSKGFTEKNVFKNKTSGSSGDPFIFAKDKWSHTMAWASIIDKFGWHGVDFNHSYQARFYGIPLDFIGNKKERLKDFLSHRYRFSVFDMSDEVLERNLQVFKKRKFSYINGYTSSIVAFAKFLKSKNTVLKDVCPTLTACITTAEMLSPEDKKLLEKQFGVPVVNEYGASELGVIAFQNKHDEWQLNAQDLYVEIVNEKNIPVAPGDEGKVVITSLYNQAHPFIRYEIGDIGILDEVSTLKKPILKKLIGRTNDFVVLPSGKRSAGLTFYYITKSVIEDDGNVREFIIRQTSLDTFEIHYVSDIILTEYQKKEIEEAVETYLESGLKIIFIRTDQLIRSKSGKLKQFESLIKK